MWLFVGPVLLSGIGQVMSKYAQLFDGSEYITFQETPKRPYDKTFAFIIPQKETFEYVTQKFKPDIVMTVCETEPVHENYRLIFDTFPLVLVPSQFCKRIFKNQFPNANIEVFQHWPGNIPEPEHKTLLNSKPYTFYTIGNVLDPRKNINMLLNAFQMCNFPSGTARLVIKATCRESVKIKTPDVLVLNGLLSDEDMERVHSMGQCYVNCSHSEGVGMGAVEAAVRDKPVIITDFGGLQEYVKTPFVIKCTETNVGIHDFLFEPHMKWGKPSLEDLVIHMKKCYEERIVHWDHTHTREFTQSSMLRTKLSSLSLALAGSSV
jgi:glycosyltransferase involved in cell wall biosynthesis